MFVTHVCWHVAHRTMHSPTDAKLLEQLKADRAAQLPHKCAHCGNAARCANSTGSETDGRYRAAYSICAVYCKALDSSHIR
jgi:hypothetical protein